MSYESVNERAARIAREEAEAKASYEALTARIAANDRRRDDLLNRYVNWLLTNRFPFTGQVTTSRMETKTRWGKTRTEWFTDYGKHYWQTKEQGEGGWDSYDGTSYEGTTFWSVTVFEDGTYLTESFGHWSSLDYEKVQQAVAKMLDQLRKKGINAVWPYND